MNWFADNLIETILIVGVVLLIVEIAVLGFSTFFLFFAGLAAIITAVLMWAGVIPEAFLYALVVISVLTLVFAALLWKPMARLQSSVDATRPTTDLVGHTFVLPEDIIATSPLQNKPLYRFSGIDWRLESLSNTVKGTVVEVTQADVGVLWVKAK
jgi:hypothetical protein